MRDDRIKWNQKYSEKPFSPDPTDIVRKYYNIVKPGKALDIASGTGKNSLFLAERGFTVEAVDISNVALSQMPVSDQSIRRICADLDIFDIPENRYDLILNIRFLNRRLFPYVREGLVKGGVLIFETYIEPVGDDFETTCRDYLLRQNELLHAFLSMKIVFYREARIREEHAYRHVASLVAIKQV